MTTKFGGPKPKSAQHLQAEADLSEALAVLAALLQSIESVTILDNRSIRARAQAVLEKHCRR